MASTVTASSEIGPKSTQFSDLPSCLVLDILLRLPTKTLSICRYVRKDWIRLYFSDPDFIRRHLETSNIQYLKRRLEEGIKFRLKCFVDEVSTGNIRIETLDFSCKLLDDPRYNWCVVNSCNGLVCLIDGANGPYRTPQPYSTTPSSRICVCNPILGELVSIPYPNRDSFFSSQCALGFSAKNNHYKILLCTAIKKMHPKTYEWKIYTLGTRRGWRSIETEGNIGPWRSNGLDFNTFIHGALHWTSYRNGNRREGFVVQSFDFETERFTVLSLPELESGYIDHMDVTLGVINGCLWASFYDGHQNASGEMWAMKDYGVDKPWTMMLAIRNRHPSRYDITSDELHARYKELVIYKQSLSEHQLMFTLNGEEMLTWNWANHFRCYNLKKPRHRVVVLHGRSAGFDCGIAYNPSFVSLDDVGKGEQVIKFNSGCGLASMDDLLRWSEIKHIRTFESY